MTRADSDQGQSIYRLRWIGYALLLLALIDIVDTLIPPNFTNPFWEFQTLGLLVEKVPVPLLGLVLIFFGEAFNRSRLEGIFLRILSWLCLLLAIFYLAMVPLGVLNTFRIHDLNKQEVNARANEQLAQLKQVEDQVSKGTNEEIKALVNQLNNIGIQVDAANPEQFKQQILEKIPQVRKATLQQQAQELGNRRLSLVKSAAKWIIGAIIASVILFIMWKSTGWAR